MCIKFSEHAAGAVYSHCRYLQLALGELYNGLGEVVVGDAQALHVGDQRGRVERVCLRIHCGARNLELYWRAFL